MRPESARASRRHLVPPSEKVLHRIGDVMVDGTIGQHPRPIAEVRGPASEAPIEVGRHIRPSCMVPRVQDGADTGLDPLETLLRRLRSQIPMTILPIAIRPK